MEVGDCGRRRLIGDSGAIGLKNSFDVGVCYGGEVAKRPVLTDLRKPTYAAGFGSILVRFRDQLVEICFLSWGIVIFGFEVPVLALEAVIFFPDSPTEGTKAFYRRAEIGW